MSSLGVLPGACGDDDGGGGGGGGDGGTCRFETVDDVVIEDNFVHDFGDVDPEQHADGFQGGGQNLVLRHNAVLLDAVWCGTGALMLEGDGSRDDLVALTAAVMDSAWDGYTVAAWNFDLYWPCWVAELDPCDVDFRPWRAWVTDRDDFLHSVWCRGDRAAARSGPHLRRAGAG